MVKRKNQIGEVINFDELELMRKRYPNAQRFKTEKKPFFDRFYSNIPKFYPLTFDERFKELMRLEEGGQLTAEEQFRKEMKRERMEAQKIEEQELKNKIAEERRKKIKKGCYSLLKEHHENLKDDPEHLTTDFLLDITGCYCQKKIEDIFFTSTPKLDERCNLFWGILDTLNMGKVHPKKK
jgi:hypothetical protein